MRVIAEDFDPSVPNIAHCRYSTSGDWRVPENNQPIVVDHMALALNGVLHMGTKAEYEEEYDIKCDVDNDAEIFLRLLKKHGEYTNGQSIIDGLRGSFAACWLVGDQLWYGRNERRPLWTAVQHGARWFASTRDILIRALFLVQVEVQPGVYRGDEAFRGPL